MRWMTRVRCCMFNYTIELANDWKNALSFAAKDSEYLHQRVLDSLSPSQLESKAWMVQKMVEVGLNPKYIVLLGGWFAQYTVPVLMDNFSPTLIYNYDIDPDVKQITYKFNKRYKESHHYTFAVHNIMFDRICPLSGVDTIINTSCEHMFPMRKFRELNEKDAIYVLQSSDDDQYDDHINCVQSVDELSDQADMIDIMYSGKKKLMNGMTRFMVIGR